MMNEGRTDSSRVLRAALHGMVWGAIIVFIGYARRSAGLGSAPRAAFGPLLLLGVGAGAIIGPLILLLNPLSTRGLLGRYAAWIIACVFAGGVIMAVLNQSLDSQTLLFGVFMGFCAGLAMGALSRRRARS